MKVRARLALIPLFLGLSSPAAAQVIKNPDAGPSVFDGDYLTFGAGISISPSYEGSNTHKLVPTYAVQGSKNQWVGGLSIGYTL